MSDKKLKLRLTLKGYNGSILAKFGNEIIKFLNYNNNVKISGPIPLPTRLKVYCVLRSPHVNKDSREHFEIRIHKRFIDIDEPNTETIKRLTKFPLPAGIDAKLSAR
jgi:small subunit ribosomal protein S10